MAEHLIDGEFQSDKYPTTPRGKVPLSCKDPMAQDLLWEYARRRREVDAEFADDLIEALRIKGFDARNMIVELPTQAALIDRCSVRTTANYMVGGVSVVCILPHDTNLLVEAAEAHLATLPKIKTSEVWRVDYAHRPRFSSSWYPTVTLRQSKIEADQLAAELALDKDHACIRVTGPHQQEVPA